MTAVDPSQRGNGRDLGGALTVDVNGHHFGVDLVQENDRSPHIPTAAELRDKEPPSTTKSPPCVWNLSPPMTPKSADSPPDRSTADPDAFGLLAILTRT